jgi:GNAT superfamily N-acetyltransferase
VERDRYAREAEPARLVDHTSPSDLRRSARHRRPARQRPARSSREAASEAGDFGPYATAFAAIDTDPAQLLVVATHGIEVVATMQLSFIPGLARRGALRAQAEAVRVAASHRSRGLGAAMFQWAIDEARRRGCALVQLTTDKTRADAYRFYERLGFTASHEGFKLQL